MAVLAGIWASSVKRTQPLLSNGADDPGYAADQHARHAERKAYNVYSDYLDGKPDIDMPDLTGKRHSKQAQEREEEERQEAFAENVGRIISLQKWNNEIVDFGGLQITHKQAGAAMKEMLNNREHYIQFGLTNGYFANRREAEDYMGVVDRTHDLGEKIKERCKNGQPVTPDEEQEYHQGVHEMGKRREMVEEALRSGWEASQDRRQQAALTPIFEAQTVDTSGRTQEAERLKHEAGFTAAPNARQQFAKAAGPLIPATPQPTPARADLRVADPALQGGF